MARVTFEGRRYPIREGESVLDALLRGGADAKYSCRKGTCQACMLQVTSGEVDAPSTSGLREELATRGYFLPCQSRPTGDLELARPNLADMLVRAHVQEREELNADVVRLKLEPETNMTFQAGQYLNVHRSSSEVRSYSIASVQAEDYYLEIHVKRIPGGAVSTWLTTEVAVGDVLDIQGPLGSSVYEPATKERTLLLLGTGSGLAPLIGVARDALLQGHTGEIFLYHGSRTAEGLYLRAELEALERTHDNFHYIPCVSGLALSPEMLAGAFPGRVVDVALSRHPSTRDFVVYLAGTPAMVHEARYRAYAAGAEREAIHADPFEYVHPFTPDDTEKLRATPPDLELWEALGRGQLLRAILEDFYDHVYEDPRLSPFFHKVTKERAIDKQYSFLADVFSGEKSYFGLRPFNAHHWMVISDELFDYRERLIESFMRRHGLAEHLIRRWCAFHELFRREIVKPAPRGLIVDGKELPVVGYTEETLTMGMVCDGCQGEMTAGSKGRLHVRTGELFCHACAARRVGATNAPGTLSSAPP